MRNSFVKKHILIRKTFLQNEKKRKRKMQEKEGKSKKKDFKF